MVIFGVQHCGATQAVTDSVKGLSSLAGLGVASIIMIVAISYEVADSNERGNAIYTLVLSCFSILISGGLWYVDTKKQDIATAIKPLYRFVVLTCFAIMWIVAACLVTFDGPFIVRIEWLARRCVRQGTDQISTSKPISFLTFSSFCFRTEHRKRILCCLGSSHLVHLCCLGCQATMEPG